MRDPELVTRAQRAATRLESAWEQWRAPHGLAVSSGRGRPSPDQVRDIAAELAGWTSGELPGQATEQLTAWPPGAPMTSDQPPAGV